VERQQAGPGGLDEKTSTLRRGIGRPPLEAGLDQVEGWRLRLEASSVPETEPVGYGLARLEDLVGLLEHEGRRLADAQR
jgi:hypothetical protein